MSQVVEYGSKAAGAINAVRNEHGQSALEFERLEELTDDLQTVAEGAHEFQGHIEFIET